MDDPPDVITLVSGLLSESESARKYAVFRLQGLLSDPSFADAFIQADGLLPLRQVVLESSGNTEAYALGSVAALLELDMGWECCDEVVLQKAVALAVSHPLVNIVRNALSLLVHVVARPARSADDDDEYPVHGFLAIKSALDQHPNFLEALVRRLSASDHHLCAKALQLVNALMRDAVAHGGQNEWPKFIKRLQDLGVIGAVGMLMRGDTASDLESPLAAAILEFQGLTKVLLRKWKDVRVNVEYSEHKRALKTIHLLSKPEPYNPTDAIANGETRARKHHPEKWRRLGFETESPAWEFDDTGYLGMMDLVDYVRRNEDAYEKILMEQSVQPRGLRCPLARASLSVTLILYEHFEIDEITDMDLPVYDTSGATSIDHLYQPLLLQWGRLHTAALSVFLRLWKDSGAETDDFFKIEEVVRIIVDRIVGSAGRKTDIGRIEDELRVVSLASGRKWQMDNLNEIYQDAWGPHLAQVREQLHHESLQFMKEQRIRCMLQGSWFPCPTAGTTNQVAWRFVKLSLNRRWLHYANYASKNAVDPTLAELTQKLDLNTVTSVDSNVSTSDQVFFQNRNDSTETLKGNVARNSGPITTTTITIKGAAPPDSGLAAAASSLPASDGLTKTTTITAADNNNERVLLELHPPTSSLASEWLDGLLMLLDQAPITKDTTSLIHMMEDWSVRLRILNLRWDDVDWDAMEQFHAQQQQLQLHGPDAVDETPQIRPVPSREGVADEYWYAMGEV